MAAGFTFIKLLYIYIELIRNRNVYFQRTNVLEKIIWHDEGKNNNFSSNLYHRSKYVQRKVGQNNEGTVNKLSLVKEVQASKFFFGGKEAGE